MIRSHAFRIRLAALTLALAALPVSAATWIWPDLVSAGPCAGTLQACINNAANGDTILIGSDSFVFPDRYTGISGNIAIGKSLTVAPMEGIDAVFEDGSIVVVTPPGVVGDVTLRGLILRSGQINVVEGGSTSATVTIDQIRMDSDPNFQCAIDFKTGNATVAVPRFVVSNSHLVLSAGSSGRDGICAFSFARRYDIDVFGNRLDARRASNAKAVAVTGGTGAGPFNVRVQRNHAWLSGAIGAGGVLVSHNNPAASSTIDVTNNVFSGAGGSLGSNTAAIELGLRNGQVHIINNSIVDGGVGVHVAAFDGDPVTGRVANNLIVGQAVRGLRFLGVAMPNDHNLLFDFAANELGPGGTLGPGTVFTDPLIESPGYPRPMTSTSPAVDAGDNTALPAFTLFDADGEKRQQGVVDIGAIEFSYDGSRIHDASAANTFGNATALDADDYPFPLFATDRLVVSPLRAAAGVSSGSANLGVYQSDTFARRWAVFNQDLSAVPAGRRYAVLLPWDSRTAVLHTVSAGNIPGAATAETEIDHVSLNSQSAAIAVVTPNWNPANTPSGNYHDHPITLVYRGNRWRIRNDDAASMNSAIGASFNLAVAPLFSPNAFMAELGGTGANEIALSHPLLDDNPCAAPVASRRVKIGDASLTLNNTPFALEYRAPINADDIGRWYIVKEDALGFSPNNAFNVIVDGAQANRCLAPKPDALFANGFE